MARMDTDGNVVGSRWCGLPSNAEGGMIGR